MTSHRQIYSRDSGHTTSRSLEVRLAPHIYAVAEAHFGSPVTDNGASRRYRQNQSLQVDVDGRWSDYSQTKFGGDALQLVVHAMGGDRKKARDWTKEFLKAPPDIAPHDPSDNAEKVLARRLHAEHLLTTSVPITGTPAEQYLKGRGINLSEWPDNIRFIENARTGEDALLAVATDADGQPAAIQLTHLVGDQKSLRTPQRITMALKDDWSKTSIFALGDAGQEPDTIYCAEGTEDALSIHQATGDPVVAWWGLASPRAPKARKAVIVADGDPPEKGTSKAYERAVDRLLLSKTSPQVSIAQVAVSSDGVTKQDINDVLRAGGVVAVRTVLDAAEPAQLTASGEAESLACMSLANAATERPAALQRLKKRYGNGFRASDFDRLVCGCRERLHEGEQAGGADDMPEPAADPVTTEELHSEILHQIRRFVAMRSQDAVIAAMYVLLTYVFELFEVCPKCIITAPTEAAGKSRLATVMGCMCNRPETSVRISAAAMIRIVDQERPTLVIAEADAWMKQSDDHRAVINASHERSEAVVKILVPDGQGGWEPQQFIVFSPQIISGIGDLHRTMMTRSFVIRMRPRLVTEKIDKLRQQQKAELRAVQAKGLRWAQGVGRLLKGYTPPQMPEGFEDRQEDNAEPILAIAELAGPEFAKKIRKAIKMHYTREQAIGRTDQPRELLIDIVRHFRETGQDELKGFLPANKLLAQLVSLEERPWGELSRGQPMTRHKMASLLQPFQITTTPKKVGRKTTRVIKWSAVKLAAERYVPDALTASLDQEVGEVLSEAETEPEATSEQIPEPVPLTPETANGDNKEVLL